MKKKENLNNISSGQLWRTKSQGLAKGNIIKIMKRRGGGYWQTIRVDEDRPKRAPTHAIREWDIYKFYDLL